MSVNKCFEPRSVTASGNSAVFLSLNRVTFLTSRKLFCLFFSIRKSNLVSLLKNTSGLIKSLSLSSFIRLFFKAWCVTLFAIWVLTPTKFFFVFIISNPYFSFLFGSLLGSK